MAENVLKLKKRAVELGMSKDAAKKAGRPELEEFISNAENDTDDGDDTPTEAPRKKKSQKKAPNRVSKKRKQQESSDENTDEAPAKRKSTKRKASGRKKAPAESRNSGKAKRPSSKRQPVERDENGLGRLNIGSLDWSATSDEWNPRPGGPVERLFKALKKARGNVDKAADSLAGDVYEFVGKTKRNGERRNKAEALAMLRYRLNRTKWEFAKRTGQHESADPDNRDAYGTGVYATTRKRRAPRKPAENTRKNNTKQATKKRTKSAAKKRSTTKKRTGRK